MRKIKYLFVPLVVCIVITLLPCNFAFAKNDVFSVDEKSKSKYLDDDSLLDVPMTYSMRRSTTLDDSTVSSTAPLNYILQSPDLIDGVIDFDNHYTWPFCSSPVDRYIDHGNKPENMRFYGFKSHDDYSSTLLYPYFSSTMVRLYDQYYGNEVIDCPLIEWTAFWHFNVSKLNEFDDDTDYLFDFELLLNDTAYDSSYVTKKDNFFVLYWDGVTSGNAGIKALTFEPVTTKRVFPNILMAKYRFTVSGKICKNIGRLGVQIYTHYQDNTAYALNGDFTIRAYTDADRLFDLGSENKIDNAAINSSILASKTDYEQVIANNQVNKTELNGVLSDAMNLFHLPFYSSALSQISTWITNLVTTNYLIYAIIITSLSISLCLFVIGRGF